MTIHRRHVRWYGLVVCLGLGLLFGSLAPAQDRGRPTLVLLVRNMVTAGGGRLDFKVTNQTDTDRLARVLFLYAAQDDVQYGRDVWVPAQSTLQSWLSVGPAPKQEGEEQREVQVLLYELSGEGNRLLLPVEERRLRTLPVTYHKKQPATALYIDKEIPEDTTGQIPGPPAAIQQAQLLVLLSRLSVDLSEEVKVLPNAPLLPAAEAFEGIDQFVLASGRLAQDAAGTQALRGWVERGGHVWVMLDLVEPEAFAPLLGDALDFQVVDRVSLTTVQVDTFGQPPGSAGTQQYEHPVPFVHVLLPPEERVRSTIGGWPVWFSRRVGRGRVVFTTLGPQAWHRPRTSRDGTSPFPSYPAIPVPHDILAQVAGELQPPKEEEGALKTAESLLQEGIGYEVVGRATVVLIFGAFLVLTLGLEAVLRRSRRPELGGWIGAAAALGAAGLFLALGESSRRGTPPTVAVTQIVDPVPETREAVVHGVLGVYRPDSGIAAVGAARGGSFELDTSGLEGRIRRRLRTDLDAWHWDNLMLPAGVRLAPFWHIVPTPEPIRAVVRFGTNGVEGKLTATSFRDLSDCLLSGPDGRNLAVRLQPDGSFRAGSEEALPNDQFLATALLTDRQQKRQEMYREFLKGREAARPEQRHLLLAWAEPIDLGFQLAPPEARTVGDALLVMPLQLERPEPGARVVVPGPLLSVRRLMDTGPTKPTLWSATATDMRLRFQLPSAVLPLEVEKARLFLKITAPWRRVTVSSTAGGAPVEIQHVDSPIDPLRIDIDDPRLLRLEEGSIHLQLTIGDAAPNATAKEKTWTIESLDLEVTGRKGKD